MSFEFWQAFSFYFGSVSRALGSGASLDADYYCYDCCRERGYRAPADGLVNSITSNCSACGKFTAVFNIADLLRVDQPDEP